jgi:hypothetical protein
MAAKEVTMLFSEKMNSAINEQIGREFATAWRYC